MHMMCGQRGGTGGYDAAQHGMPAVPAPMAFFGMAVAFMLGMLLGLKKSMMLRHMRMGGGGMGMHHHHKMGSPACSCGQDTGGTQYDREEDRPEGGG